jgi:hypothetical protein
MELQDVWKVNSRSVKSLCCVAEYAVAVLQWVKESYLYKTVVVFVVRFVE